MRPSETYTTLIALLGEAQALKLIGAHGGTPVVITALKRLSDESELVKLLGWSAAKDLSRFYDGATLDVPLGRNIQIQARNELIWREHENGIKNKFIARKHGITTRTVRKIIAKMNDKPCREEASADQMDLFLS